MRHADYGYDAPYFPAIFGFLSVVTAIAAAYCLWEGDRGAARIMFIYFVILFGNTVSFLYTTRRGKFREWEQILDRLAIRGDEQVLDMGCGRGAVLIAFARRLSTGQIFGIDIWIKTDQSGNGRDVTLRNAALEGVDDRIRVDTGDMRALPYADATFDVIVSSLAIHNISSNADRKKAIAEGFRVLKPGGRMVIADIRATAVYEKTLLELGASNVERSRLGWRFWWGNPVAATTLLTASKAP